MPANDEDRLRSLVGQIVIDEWANIFDDNRVMYALAKWLHRRLTPADQALLKTLFVVDVTDPEAWNPDAVPAFVRKAYAAADRRYLSA